MWTKEQWREYGKKYRAEHKEEKAAYLKKWYAEHSEVIRDWQRENTDKVAGYVRKHQEKYPQKRKARVILNSAIKCKRITKQPCEVCGSLRVDGHHDDYSKPLEVRWLCRKHHLQLHSEVHNGNHIPS